jgi:hypothetical protein
MTTIKLLCSTLLVLALPGSFPRAWAQQSGQGGATGTRGDNSRQKNPGTTAPRQIPQVLFLSGTIVMEDGSAIPSGIVIERQCNGQVRREATADSNGNFSFQIGGSGRSSTVLPDASDSSWAFPDTYGNSNPQMSDSSPASGVSPSANLVGCEIRAHVGGYRSSTITITDSSLMGQTDIGAIVLSPLAKVAGTLISATDLMAPKEARKALERAQKEMQKKNLAEAEKQLKTAIEIYPHFAAAWFGLGCLYEYRRQNDDARAAFQKAIDADRMYVRPYIQLAQLSGREGKWQEVIDITDHALALDPLDSPEGYFLNAIANYNLHNLTASEHSALKAQRLDGRHLVPQVHLILADIMEQKQDLAGAMTQLRNYLKFAPPSAAVERVRSRLVAMEQTPKEAASAPAVQH